MSEVPVFIMKEFYLLDHILEAELLQIDPKVIFMRHIYLDMAHPRGRASAHRPQGYLYGTHSPRHGIILEFLLNELRPHFLHSVGDMMNGKLFG